MCPQILSTVKGVKSSVNPLGRVPYKQRLSDISVLKEKERGKFTPRFVSKLTTVPEPTVSPRRIGAFGSLERGIAFGTSNLMALKFSNTTGNRIWKVHSNKRQPLLVGKVWYNE